MLLQQFAQFRARVAQAALGCLKTARGDRRDLLNAEVAFHLQQKRVTLLPGKLRYREEITGKLREEFSYENVMQIPGLVKIVVNMGVGDAARDSKLIEGAIRDLATITGQKPQVTKARKSIAQFKLREGQPIGAHVTLRGDRMWEFLDRLIAVALPRVRDFRGIPSKSFDGRGNYTLGIRDHLIFPEVDYNKVEKPKGMNITIVTTAGNDERALYLLRELGMPFIR